MRVCEDDFLSLNDVDMTLAELRLNLSGRCTDVLSEAGHWAARWTLALAELLNVAFVFVSCLLHSDYARTEGAVQSIRTSEGYQLSHEARGALHAGNNNAEELILAQEVPQRQALTARKYRVGALPEPLNTRASAKEPVCVCLTVISRRMFGITTLGSGRLISLIATSSPPLTALNNPVSPLPPVPSCLMYSQSSASILSGASDFGAAREVPACLPVPLVAGLDW